VRGTGEKKDKRRETNTATPAARAKSNSLALCAVANSTAQLADAGKCSIAVERERVLEDETLTRGSEAQLSRLLCGDDEGPVRVSLPALSLRGCYSDSVLRWGFQTFNPFSVFRLVRFFWLCVDAVYQKDDLSC
jgi:hypothetical protein